MFIFHKGNASEAWAIDLTSSTLSNIGTSAVSIGITRHQEALQRRVLEAAVQNGVVALADPRCSLFLRPLAERGAERDGYQYISQIPTDDVPGFVRSCLDSQLALGASAVITPWLTHGTEGGLGALPATIEMAREGLRYAEQRGIDALVGIEVTAGVVESAEERHSLLNDLVELPPSTLHLGCLVPHALEGRKQLTSKDYLDGLHELVSALTGDGFKVLMPRTGPLGILLAAFGAEGMGAGFSASDNLARIPAPRTGGGGRRLQWYWVDEFASFFLLHEVQELVDLDLIPECACPYCAAAPDALGIYDQGGVSCHYVNRVHQRWAGTVEAPALRRQRVREWLESAQDLWQQAQAAGVEVDRRSGPLHVEDWLLATD